MLWVLLSSKEIYKQYKKSTLEAVMLPIVRSRTVPTHHTQVAWSVVRHKAGAVSSVDILK